MRDDARERMQAADVIRREVEDRSASLVSSGLQSLLDPTVRGVVRDVCARVGADEGSVWWLDPTRSALEVAYNSGPNAVRLIGHARQPLGRGLVSMVVSSEQAHVENEPSALGGFSPDIDRTFGQRTRALVAVPLYVGRRCGGALSFVQLGDAPRSGFGVDDLQRAQRAARLIDDLLDLRLLRAVLGGDA